MNRRYEDYDESAVKVRPPRRGSRPRTKDRPDHADAEWARVVSVDRGRWRTVIDAGTPDERAITAVRARNLGRTPIVPGDVVGLVGDTSGREDTLARIVKLQERTSFLRRSADDDDSSERPLVANVDVMAIVTALADPEPRGGMVDRCLVAAAVAGVEPLLVLTKADLRSPDDFVRTYAPLGVPWVATQQSPDGSIAGLDHLREHLHERTTVLIGHSGVGKSTLLNALVPGADRATGAVNAVTGRGRHTSSSALAMPLTAGGWVIDTPGVRSFGLGHVEPDELLQAFTDLAALAEQCPRGCTHAEDAPDCELDAQVEAGKAGPAGPARLASFRRLDAALRRNDPWEM